MINATLQTLCGCTQYRVLPAAKDGRPLPEFRIALLQPYSTNERGLDLDSKVTTRIRCFELVDWIPRTASTQATAKYLERYESD